MTAKVDMCVSPLPFWGDRYPLPDGLSCEGAATVEPLSSPTDSGKGVSVLIL